MTSRSSLAAAWGRRAALVLLILASLGATASGAEHRVVTVGVYDNPPKVSANAGSPEGFFIDIIEHVAREEGWTLRYVSGSWSEGLERLGAGGIDLMPDVAFSAERNRTMDFHQVAVLPSWSQVYAIRGSGIRSILDLNGKRIAVLDHSIQQATLGNLMRNFGLNATLVPAPDLRSVLRLAADGQVEAAVTNRFHGLRNAGAAGLEETAIVFEPCDLFFAARKGAAADLLARIDARLVALKQDQGSAYYAALERWTSQKVSFQLPAWLRIGGIIGAAVLLLSLGGSVILRRQVNARTRELRQINQEMETRIVQRTAELAAAMERAQAADRLKSSFLATMSHELRTPLNSIIGFTGILLRGLPGALNPEQSKQLGMVQGSARHLLALINDVLDMSKIEAGQLVLSSARFDVRDSLERMLKVVSPLAEKAGIGLRLEPCAAIGEIVGDQRRVEQVFLNLLTNAIKFTERGEVLVRCRDDGDHCLVSFVDTGIGMRSEEIPDLFKAFHQADTGLARKREGTGLGLSICKRLLDAMGATIAVDSVLGQGSTFTIRIPRQAGGAPDRP